MKLTIEDHVREMLQIRDIDPGKRKFYKLVLGEFNRIDDGKPINDIEACKVLKKMIKSNIEMMELVDDWGAVILGYENSIMKSLMPKEVVATKMQMLEAIENSVPPGARNRLSCMKPCIQYLEARDLVVDKGELSALLRSGE